MLPAWEASSSTIIKDQSPNVLVFWNTERSADKVSSLYLIILVLSVILAGSFDFTLYRNLSEGAVLENIILKFSTLFMIFSWPAKSILFPLGGDSNILKSWGYL